MQPILQAKVQTLKVAEEQDSRTLNTWQRDCPKIIVKTMSQNPTFDCE